MIKILVVDDHAIFRKGLIMVVNRIEDFEVIGEATNGEECIKLLSGLNPDLILMDVQMPFMDGIQTTFFLQKHYPEIKVVALSMFGEGEYLHQMIEAGVSGFLLKNIEKEELSIAVRQICRGNPYYSPELLPMLTNRLPFEKESRIKFSRREREVLQEIAKGKTNQEIADALFISKRTVDGHKTKLIHKTGSRNVLSLLIYALKNDLVELD